MYVWNTRSTTSDTIKAMFKLSNPIAQNPEGTVPFVLRATVPVLLGHSCPPLLHSQMILSFPRWSWTIMMIARTAQITITNGHKNLTTRIQMYDRFERAKALMMAAAATPRPIPPYICHSGKKKKKYWPLVRRKMPPAMLYAAITTDQAIAPALRGNTRRQLSHHIAID